MASNQLRSSTPSGVLDQRQEHGISSFCHRTTQPQTNLSSTFKENCEFCSRVPWIQAGYSLEAFNNGVPCLTDFVVAFAHLRARQKQRRILHVEAVQSSHTPAGHAPPSPFISFGLGLFFTIAFSFLTTFFLCLSPPVEILFRTTPRYPTTTVYSIHFVGRPSPTDVRLRGVSCAPSTCVCFYDDARLS